MFIEVLLAIENYKSNLDQGRYLTKATQRRESLLWLSFGEQFIMVECHEGGILRPLAHCICTQEAGNGHSAV